MFVRRCGRARRVSAFTAVGAVVGCVATMVIGTATPAGASPTTASDAASNPPTALCPQVPGRRWCLAERAPVSAPTAPTGTMRPATASPDSTTPYGPADLRAAYDVPTTTTTTTTTVAVVDAYGAANVESDLGSYRSYFGLPACTSANGCLSIVNQDGATSPLPAENDDWVGETTLDVEMVSAICPSCHILLVQANDDDRSGQPDLETAVSTAVRLGAQYVSMSWGSSEFSQETILDRTYLGAPNVTYVAAAGDGGYQTSWPAVAPNVVAVGGTTLVRDSTTARGWRESVWSGGSSGTGSGCSSYEAQPSWQGTSAGVTTACPTRAMNDLAAVADPNPGVLVYQGGQWWRYGGTSAGTPMIAAMEAIAGMTSGATSYPYTHQSSFNDVTSGSNGSCGTVLCQAGTGWDGPTGVGTPDGLAGLGPAAGLTTPPTGSSSPTNGSGSSGSSNSNRPTNPNPPAVSVHNPGTVNGFAGQAVTIDVAATDAAGLAVTYSATGLPSGTAVGSTGRITGRPRTAGSYHVTVTATDTSGASGSTRFSWQVKTHRIVTSARPHIAGTLRHGRTVRASWGTFRTDSKHGARVRPAVHVQWFAGGRAVQGATHDRFRIPARYRGKRISFRVVADAVYFARYTSTVRGPRVH